MKLITKIGLGALATAVAVLIPVMTIAGWYPDRPLKAWTGPNTTGFDYVTFNSFTNVPDGNEQQFFDGKKWNTTPGGFQDPIKVKVGDEIKLRTYIHNNADSSLNGAGSNYAGIARNTRVKITLPNGVGTEMNAVSQISADNAKPGSVYDTTNFTSEDGTPYRLSYVAGSAYADTNAGVGIPVSDSIVGAGANIGDVPGCFENDRYVIVKVKVEAAPITIEKTVARPSQAFVENVEAKPGERLYFRLSFKNTGSTTQTNMALTDKLPEQLKLIPGTVKLYNGTDPNGMALSDNGLFSAGGQNVGDYAGGVNGYVLYQVTVKDNASDTLTNIGCVRSTEVPYLSCDDAKVVTPKVPTPPTPINPVTPTTPSGSLPETGIESGLAGILGMTGISASVYAYQKSKKSVSDAMRAVGQK